MAGNRRVASGCPEKTKAGEEGESLAGPPETVLRARLDAQQWYPRNTTVAGPADNHEDRRQPQYLACPESGLELELGRRYSAVGRPPAGDREAPASL